MISIKSAINTILLRRSESATILLRKVGAAFMVNVTGTAIAFGLQVLLTRMLGLEGFGHYIYALTWINLCVLVAKFGLDTAALRYIPEYKAQAQWGLLKGFLHSSGQAALATSFFIAGVIAIVVTLLGERIDASLSSVFFLSCLLLPLSAYLIVHGAHLQGFKHIVFAQAPQVILRPLLLALGLIIMSQFTTLHGAADIAMILNIGATIAAIGAMAVAARSVYPSELGVHKPEYQIVGWGKVAFSMMFITSFSLVLNQADLIMVGTMVSTTDAGIYATASRVATLLTFGITLVNSIAAPLMSQLYAQGMIQQLQRMLTYVAWGSFLFATPLCIGVILWNKEILSVFGDGFVGGAGALTILAVGRWVNALTGAAGYLLAMSGREKQAAYILGANALLNIVLNFLLIPIYGIDGAAVATLITTVSWSLLMLAYGKKYIGVNASLSLRFT